MAKSRKNTRRDQNLEQLWEDLEAYRNFCRDFGYKFDEKDLYNMRTYPFQQFNKFRNGKNCKDQWQYDLNRFHGKPVRRDKRHGAKR